MELKDPRPALIGSGRTGGNRGHMHIAPIEGDCYNALSKRIWKDFVIQIMN
jgi:hypothetical protein